MSVENGGRATIDDVYRIVDRLDSKLDRRLDAQDQRIREVKSEVDSIKGAIGLVRWLGPAGVGAVLLGLLTVAAAAAGFHVG